MNYCIENEAFKCFQALYIDDYYFEDDYLSNTSRAVKIVQSAPTFARAQMLLVNLQMGARLNVPIDYHELYDYERPRCDLGWYRKHPTYTTLETFLSRDQRGWQEFLQLWLEWKASIDQQLSVLPSCLAQVTRSYILYEYVT